MSTSTRDFIKRCHFITTWLVATMETCRNTYKDLSSSEWSALRVVFEDRVYSNKFHCPYCDYSSGELDDLDAIDKALSHLVVHKDELQRHVVERALRSEL